MRVIQQCAVRPTSGNDRYATRFNTWTFTFHHIHERFNSRNIRHVIDMYADDSTLYTTSKCVAVINRSRTVTTNSKQLYDWIDANCMVLNADKTECMLLGTRQKLRCANANFCVRGNYVTTPVKTYKLLGLHVDSNLSWSRMYT